MTGEVNGIGGGAVLITESRGKQERTEADGGPASAAPAATDEVTLTEAAARLKALEGQAGDYPVVDTGRVEAVRKALSEGGLQVDDAELAKKLIQMERALGDALKG
jgi:negative regulator of flagellin synthesis FlgM